MATVKHVEHGDGSHSIGVELDGIYHPFASIAAHRIAQHAERVATLNERAELPGDEGDAAREVLDRINPAEKSKTAEKGAS